MNKNAFKACFLLTTLQRNINKQQEHTTINNKIRKKKARRKKEVNPQYLEGEGREERDCGQEKRLYYLSLFVLYLKLINSEFKRK